MGTNYNKIETDNPLLDELVYNSKLILKSCIVKDERQAISNETVDSLKNSDIYMAIRENRVYFTMFEYTKQDMIANSIESSLINSYLSDYKLIPKPIMDKLMKYKEQQFLLTYEEQNNYYRRLMGLPDINEPHIFITENYNNLINENIPTDIPIHKLDTYYKNIISTTDIILKLKEDNPKLLWLNYYNKGIDSYYVRKLNKFGIVYFDENNIEPTISNRFKQVYETNRIYIIRTMDKDSLRLYNKYYDRFMILLIMAQTFCDIVAEMPDYYIRRDVFDIRTCEYFFEANGVEFFPDIPLKFQKKLVQNLNLLLKFSSTQRNIIDICSIFGFKDMKVFKYYMLKEHIRDEDGKYVPVIPEDLSRTYDLRFIKVPIDKNVDNYVKDITSYEKYNDVVSQDEYWNGPYDHDFVKQKILEREFSIEKTKFISIDSVYNLAENSFSLVYFTNMLLWSGIDTKNITLKIPSISTSESVTLQNAFLFLYALTYMYSDIEDLIYQQPSQYLTIKGFNFNADLLSIAEYVANKGYTLEDLGVEGFQVPQSGIPTLSQMMSIFINNKNIYDHVSSEMYKADNKEIYDCYKMIYDSLFYMELNEEYYYVPKLYRIAKTYTEYLQYNDSKLYNILMKTDSIEESILREETIITLISDVSNYILSWIDNDQFDEIFSKLPSNNRNYIHHYITEVVDFFLSYKNTLLDFRNIYRISDEHVFITDTYNIHYIYNKEEYMKVLDMLNSYKSTFTIDTEYVDIEDVIAALSRSFTILYGDKYDPIMSKFKSMIMSTNYIDMIPMRDVVNIVSWVMRLYNNYYTLKEQNIIVSRLNKKERIELIESYMVLKTYS